MAVSPWWELSCSFTRVGPLSLTSADQWRRDTRVAGRVERQEEKIFKNPGSFLKRQSLEHHFYYNSAWKNNFKHENTKLQNQERIETTRF